MKKAIAIILAAMAGGAFAQELPQNVPVKRADFEIRDPFILTENGKYHCYFSKSWHGGRDVKMRTSDDLENWSEYTVVMKVKDEWGVTAVWAPEVHKWRGKYYLLVTLHCRNPKVTSPGTWAFVSDRPEGPFEPVRENAVVTAERSIDGTLATDPDGTLWYVYCNALAGKDCAMKAVRAKEDLSGTEGEAVELFTWRAIRDPMKTHGVSEGAAFHRAADGGLYMTWSNIACWGYCVALAKSETGKVAGPWKQLGVPIRIDGGHGAFFNRKDGKTVFTLHAPNNSSTFERMVFADVIEKPGEMELKLQLPIVDRWWGAQREIFEFRGLTAWVMKPKKPAEGNPWTWNLHWAGNFADRMGIHNSLLGGYWNAAVDVADLDDAKALETMEAFREFIIEKYGLAAKANLIGTNRGGRLALAYAEKHPEQVNGMYLDSPAGVKGAKVADEIKALLSLNPGEEICVTGKNVKTFIYGEERKYPGLDDKDRPMLNQIFKMK